MTTSLIPDPQIKLLLVDLNDRRREDLIRLLATRGYGASIMLATSPQTLVATLSASTVDAILCHRDLPGLSLSQIRALLRERGEETPLIPLPGPGGEASLMDALEQEITLSRQRTDHQAAMEMLRESETRFRALANNIPGMAFELTREVEGRYAFAYVSEGCQKLLGLKPHELHGNFSRLVDVIDPEDRVGLTRALEESARLMDTLNWEGRARTRSQLKPKWVNFRSSP